MSHPDDDLQDLRRKCEKLSKDPDTWEPEDLAKDFVLDLMDHFVKTTPRKGVSTDLTADLCDLFGPWSPGGMKATYERVAEWTGKSPDAVRKAHKRNYGLTKY